MKIRHFILIITLFFIVVLMSACTRLEKNVLPEAKKDSGTKLEQQAKNSSDIPISKKNEKIAKMQSPSQTIYKTKGDYYNLVYVGISYNQFGKLAVSSFPDIRTIKIRTEGSDWKLRPEKLHKDYLLDYGKGGTGINQKIAFLKLTYEEYANLEKQPSTDELLNLIMDNNPITELYKCGDRANFIGDIYYKDDDFINKINEMIDNDQLDTVCKVIKKPRNKTHFKTVWSNNGYKPMAVVLKQAHLGNINIPLVAGDEIGIFDGDLCVGAGVLKEPFTDVFPISVSADDPTTSKIDGYIEGHPIKYRLWKSNIAHEFTNATAVYDSTLNNTFVQLDTALVSLKWELPPEKIEINCAKVGERPSYFDFTTGKENFGGRHCCLGLKEIEAKTSPENLEKGICFSLSGSSGICSLCGNNVCEFEYEDKCNCPEDCLIK